MTLLSPRVNENDNFMKPVILIKKDKSELLTNSSLMLIKGEVGSGKSRLAMNMMKGLLLGKEDLNLEYVVCPDDKFVIYFSTEMSKYHLQRRLLKVLEGVPQKDHNKLVFLDACSLKPEEKLLALNEAVQVYPPHVIIIDQLADFVSNINDIEQANQIISKLMNGIEKTDCAIVGIVHQNEDSGINAKARGHLGSVFEQKVVSSIGISDSSKGFKIKTTKLREGKQVEINAVFNEATEMLIEKEKQPLFDVKDLEFPISRTDLIEKLNKAFDIKERSSANMISKYLEDNILSSYKNGTTTMYKRYSFKLQ